VTAKNQYPCSISIAFRSPPKRKSTPPEVDLEKLCAFCCKEVDGSAAMDEHVRQRHLEAAFVCRLCSGKTRYDTDLLAVADHLRKEHGKDDVDGDEMKDYVHFPSNLRCIKCNMCGLLAHGQSEAELELHFNIFHEDVAFSTRHLDYLCRLCMKSGQNDSAKELDDHLLDRHPDETK
jgi:hypothetical protein